MKRKRIHNTKPAKTKEEQANAEGWVYVYAPKLYVAGIQYGWRKLRGIWGSTRKKLCVRKAHPPLSAFRRGAHDAPTTRKGQCENAYEPDNDRCIQHVYLIVACHF